MMKNAIVILAVAAAGSLAAALPENTCVVSGDVERQRVSAVEVEWEGSLDTCWRSLVEDLAGDRFRSTPVPGTILIIR